MTKSHAAGTAPDQTGGSFARFWWSPFEKHRTETQEQVQRLEEVFAVDSGPRRSSRVVRSYPTPCFRRAGRNVLDPSCLSGIFPMGRDASTKARAFASYIEKQISTWEVALPTGQVWGTLPGVSCGHTNAGKCCCVTISEGKHSVTFVTARLTL
jgi:hypothetical protein